MVPTSKPQWSEHRVRTEAWSKLNEVQVHKKVSLLVVRGYYRDSMGVKGRNDRGIYDDALFLVSPNGVQAFNANADPSKYRKGIATLATGVWMYKVGIHGISKPAHRRYEALVQAAKVEVIRDGGKRERGYFGINTHKGGYHTTSSEGCITVYPSQWDSFIALVKSELKREGQTTIPVIVIEEQG